jgi:hypothetical protein
MIRRTFLPTLLLAFAMVWSTSAFASMIIHDDFNQGIVPEWKAGQRISWQPSGGPDGSPCIRINYLSAGTSPHIFSRMIPGEHQELYFKFNFKVVGYPSGGAKFLKVRALKDDKNYANTTWMINYDTGRLKEISFGNGRSRENDTQQTIRYNGTLSRSTTGVTVLQATDERDIPPDTWHTFEAHMRYNSNGQADGEYQVWINGEPVVHAANLVNRHNDNPMHFNWLYLGNYSHGNWQTPWELYYDNLVISTVRLPDPPPVLAAQPEAGAELPLM